MQTTSANGEPSLVSQIDDLGRRIKEASERFDLKAFTEAHPLVAIGAAFAVGALLGMAAKHKHSSDRGIVGGAIAALFTAIAMGAVKDLAMRNVATAAKDWLGDKPVH
jgi:hypothetical protein